MKEYTGGYLSGTIIVTRKLDGVQAIWGSDHKARSRNGKPLYNLPEFPGGMRAEVYLGSFKESISAVKTHDGKLISLDHIYSLDPMIDDRLRITSTHHGIGEDEIRQLFRYFKDLGDEGLVLHFSDGREPLKVKDKLDVAVRIEGYTEGTGRNKGRMGAIHTNHGKVGSGFTDADREYFWNNRVKTLGDMIEVQFMEWTSAGKMRHPRFIKLRPDIT